MVNSKQRKKEKEKSGTGRTVPTGPHHASTIRRHDPTSRSDVPDPGVARVRIPRAGCT